MMSSSYCRETQFIQPSNRVIWDWWHAALQLSDYLCNPLNFTYSVLESTVHLSNLTDAICTLNPFVSS